MKTSRIEEQIDLVPGKLYVVAPHETEVDSTAKRGWRVPKKRAIGEQYAQENTVEICPGDHLMYVEKNNKPFVHIFLHKDQLIGMGWFSVHAILRKRIPL